MNIKQIITVGVAGVAMGAMALDNVEVTDVKARQRYPWNGKVDIDFTLDSKPTEPYQMQVEVYDNVGKTNLPVKSVCTEGVSVEANPCMVCTDTARIIWDASKDLPNGFKCTNVLVTCRDARLTPVDKLYCVVNLADGSKEYLSSIPAGGWTDVHKTTKMVFRRIEAGTFMMGSPLTEVNRQSNEAYHKVKISKPYYISVFELTGKQQSVILGGSNVSMSPALCYYATVRGSPYEYSRYSGSSYQTGYCWPSSSDVDPNSIVGVLRTRTGISSIDLPTEAQWELAAKASCLKGVPTGKDKVDAYTTRYDGNKTDGRGEASSQAATTVGSYMCNAWGLYDVVGNAEEWCRDAFMDDLGIADVTDPVGNTANVTMRVVKGGGFYGYLSISEHVDYTDVAASDASVAKCRCAYRRAACAATGSRWEAWTREYHAVRLMFVAE